eukprot:6205133-Pleurochrysis_carterae.AAC.4
MQHAHNGQCPLHASSLALYAGQSCTCTITARTRAATKTATTARKSTWWCRRCSAWRKSAGVGAKPPAVMRRHGLT